MQNKVNTVFAVSLDKLIGAVRLIDNISSKIAVKSMIVEVLKYHLEF